MTRVLASRQLVRSIVTSHVKRDRPDISKIKEKQKMFQIDNDVPVYLKGGAGDRALYFLTLGSTVVGLGLSGYSLYRMITHN